MKFGKKLLAVVLAAVLALSMLTACGGGGGTPLIQPDIEKGKEIAAALNEARVAAGEDEVAFDEEYTVKLTEYANAFADWQCAVAAYQKDPTNKNSAVVEAAKKKFNAMVELPAGISGGQTDKINVEWFDTAKANGRNYFAGTDKNGNYYPLATEKGDMCAVTVITKGEFTFAVLLVSTKSTK